MNNFKAIPVHDYHLKHIRIDTKQFYEIASKFMVLKEAKGKRGQPVNISREVYNSYPAYFWGKLFDMDKINQIGGNNKQFDCSIVTNSVSVSINYIKLNCESNEIGLEQIKEMYDKCEFVFELGIDPGIKTFNATVRRRIENQTEVNEHLVKFTYKLLIDYFVCIFFRCRKTSHSVAQSIIGKRELENVNKNGFDGAKISLNKKNATLAHIQ